MLLHLNYTFGKSYSVIPWTQLDSECQMYRKQIPTTVMLGMASVEYT